MNLVAKLPPVVFASLIVASIGCDNPTSNDSPGTAPKVTAVTSSQTTLIASAEAAAVVPVDVILTVYDKEHDVSSIRVTMLGQSQDMSVAGMMDADTLELQS